MTQTYALTVGIEAPEYAATKIDIECWIHVDVPYRRFTFGVGNHVYEFDGEPTANEPESMVSKLRS